MSEPVDRRNVIKLSGAVLGGIATGTTVVGAERTDRFLVDLAGRASVGRLERAGLAVDHDLSAVDLAVVTGAESDVEGVTPDYAPDTAIALDLPVDRVTLDETTDDQQGNGEGNGNGNGTGKTRDAADTTNEDLYPLQWDKQAQAIPDAHDVTRGEGTRVAIVDTGVAAGHPDLQHAVNTELSRDFTGDGYGAGGPYGGYHGTHVAGIVAADDRNDAGVVGTAPGTEIVDCRVFSPDELASFADIVAAIVYSAAIGADAANMSIGAYPVSRKAIGQFYGQTLNRVTTYADSQGTLLVASAGNAGADLQHDGRVCADFDGDGDVECAPAISLPNEAAGVMSISATGPIGFGWGDEGLEEPFESPAFYTNYGTNAVSVGAPGGDVDLETDDPEYYLDLVVSSIAEPVYDDGTYQGAEYTYGWAAGTSMAAPQVTGAAALVRSERPGATTGAVESMLQRTAAVPEGYDRTYYGAGFLDPVGALEDA